MVFSGDRLLLVAPVSLINQAACAKIIIDGKTIDQLCYPQAEE